MIALVKPERISSTLQRLAELGTVALALPVVLAGCRLGTCDYLDSNGRDLVVLARFDDSANPTLMTCIIGARSDARLLVDTGWGHPAITSEASRTAALKTVDTVIGSRGNAGRSFSRVTSSAVATTDWRLTRSLRLVEDDRIGRLPQRPDVVTGLEPFWNCGVIRVSVSRGVIELIPGATIERTDSCVRLRVRRGVPWVEAHIGDRAIELAIDTGSDASLSVTRDYLGVDELRRGGERRLAVASWGEVPWTSGVLTQSLRLGAVTVPRSPVCVADVTGEELPQLCHLGRGALTQLDVDLDVASGLALFRRAGDLQRFRSDD